jgi:hypothetical protein
LKHSQKENRLRRNQLSHRRFYRVDMPIINPYEWPQVSSEWDTGEIPPELVKRIRNIRTICILYAIFGVIGILAGYTLLGVSVEDASPNIAIALIVLSCMGIITAVGILQRRRWGISVCIFFSTACLPFFPIGTMLGVYMIYNVGKVEEAFP